MSIRRPSWSGRKRRVGTGLIGSLSAAIARFASASSSADMSSKVHLLQHFLGREGEHRVELDLDVLLILLLVWQTWGDGLAGPPARRRCLGLGQPVARHDRPLNRALQADLAPEQVKRLVEDVVLIAPLDEDGVERPVEVAAAGGIDRLDGAHRRDGLARPRRQAGAAQAPHEVHDVVGERAARLRLDRHRVRRHDRGAGRAGPGARPLASARPR